MSFLGMATGSTMAKQKTVTASSVDPYFADVVFLAGFNGADGATTYTEESSSAQEGTFFGTGELDTAITRVGSASFTGDGSDDYVSFPNNTGVNLSGAASIDFTIEFSIYFDLDISGSVPGFMAVFDNTAGQQGWEVAYSEGSGGLGFYWSPDGTSDTWWSAQEWDPAATTWYDIAIVRASEFYYFFIDGVQLGTEDQGNGTRSIYNSPQPLEIGRLAHSGVPLGVNGNIDEVRITNGTARYTSDYTVSLPFPRS